MRARTASAALLAAAALVAAPAAAAVAANPQGVFGKGRAAKAEARATAGKLEAKLNGSHGKRSFVLGGRVVAVTLPADDTTPGTLTLTVRGGRFKNLRGTDVTVLVSADAKVTRDGVQDLSAVLVGDHVVVRSRQLDLSVTKEPGVGWTLTGTATAVRVVANASASSVEPAEPADGAPTTA